MRARLAPFKPAFVLVLLIAVPLVALVVVNLLVAHVMVEDKLNFQTLMPDTSVRVADYSLEYSKQNLILKNTLTQAAANIVEGYKSVLVPPAYAQLRFEDRTYLITRLASGGNSGAYWFKVIRLDRDQGHDLTDPVDNPNIGLSCANPRLNGNALVFEMSLKCAAGAAVPDSSYQKYQIPLN